MAYVVKGREDSGEVFPRLEIRDLPGEEPEQWTLFILALTKIQNQGSMQSFPADFVNIGGIHGLPYRRFPGDPASGDVVDGTVKIFDVASDLKGQEPEKRSDAAKAIADTRFGGYCHHGSVLFPSWHRPLMMAIEQSIGEIATNIAQDFARQYPNEEAKWVTAAKKLRFPFWDWTLLNTEDGLPALITDLQVLISMPNAMAKSVDNPLSTFNFGSSLPDGFANTTVSVPDSDTGLTTAYYKDWTRTCRSPRSEPTANDDYVALNKRLKDHHNALRRNVGHLFSFSTKLTDSARTWDEFSNTTFQSATKVTHNAKSLEAPHNSIHVYTGGIGHMGDPDYAGFDPLFYLHHSNVDRLYALWEYVYPSYWMGAGYDDESGKLQYFTQPDGTISQLDKSRVDQATDLHPFRKDIDSYWTSSDARGLLPTDSATKWYTYPPVAGVHVSKPSTPAEREIHRLNLQKHFGVHATPVTAPHASGSPILDQKPESIPEGQVHIENYRHVVIAVALVEHAFNQSYTFEVEYATVQGVVEYGHVAVFTRGKDTRCTGCIGRRAAGGIVHGLIHIPAAHLADVLAGGKDDGKTVEDEIAYLKEHLTARIMTADGSEYIVTRQGQSGLGRVLDDAITPKTTLHMAFGCHSNQGSCDDMPSDLFGWEDCGEVFSGKWERA